MPGNRAVGRGAGGGAVRTALPLIDLVWVLEFLRLCSPSPPAEVYARLPVASEGEWEAYLLHRTGRGAGQGTT